MKHQERFALSALRRSRRSPKGAGDTQQSIQGRPLASNQDRRTSTSNIAFYAFGLLYSQALLANPHLA